MLWRAAATDVRHPYALACTQPPLLSRVLDVGKFLELDVIESAVHFPDLSDVNRLYDVAGLRVDHDRAARTHKLHALQRSQQFFRVDRSLGLFQRFCDRR